MAMLNQCFILISFLVGECGPHIVANSEITTASGCYLLAVISSPRQFKQ
jgi:hypothetical protein